MSQVVTTKPTWKRCICPVCGFYCARRRGGVIQCLSSDHIRPCQFIGTLEDADSVNGQEDNPDVLS